MASRFSGPAGQPSSGGYLTVYTALAAVGFLAMLTAVLWMDFHNMDYSKDFSRSADPGISTILDQ